MAGWAGLEAIMEQLSDDLDQKEAEKNDPFIQACKRIEEMEESVRELAKQISPDYPNVEHCPFWELLWSISAAYQGTSSANNDMHRLCGHLQKRLGWDVHQTIEEWDKLRGKQPNPYKDES